MRPLCCKNPVNHAIIESGMTWKSKGSLLVALSAAAVTLIALTSSRAESKPPLRTVDSVDLNRYAGRWYEIARYPNRFQKKCSADTSAIYSLRNDGRIEVVNSCRKQDGEFTSSRGTAKVVDRKTNAKLKVTFFWPFSGNYWIIGLDPEYRYAIVGEPSRKYLWILSRTPELNEALYNNAIRQIDAAGYDPSKLMLTRQSGALRPTG